MFISIISVTYVRMASVVSYLYSDTVIKILNYLRNKYRIKTKSLIISIIE